MIVNHQMNQIRRKKRLIAFLLCVLICILFFSRTLNIVASTSPSEHPPALGTGFDIDMSEDEDKDQENVDSIADEESDIDPIDNTAIKPEVDNDNNSQSGTGQVLDSENQESENDTKASENPDTILSDEEREKLKAYIDSHTANSSQVVNMANMDQEPFHRKYIEATSYGTYLLNLEVTGESKIKLYPADIVVVFDISSSTSDAMLASFKHAASKLADILLTKENEALAPEKQTRVAIVTFNQDAYLHCDFTSSRAVFDSYMNKVAVITGNTNWSAPLELANQLLSREDPNRPDVRKYTLFQTDGVPNRPNVTEFDSYNTAYFSARKLISNGVTLFSLAVLDKDNHSGSIFVPYVRADADHPLVNIADYSLNYKDGFVLAPDTMTRHAYRYAGRDSEENGKFFVADKDNDSDFVEAFRLVAEEISGQLDYTNVTITDTLSDYVVFQESVDKDGNVLGGTVVKTDGVSSEPISNYTLKYDKASNTIQFNVADRLEHGMIYRFTFEVSPSQQPFDELADNRASQQYSKQNGYPHIGEADTGSTSEGKYGFYSNKEATLTYYVIDKNNNMGPELTAAPFNKPVIQVQLGTIAVQKNWEKVPVSERPKTIEIILKQNGKKYRSKTLDAESGWSAVFNDIPGGPHGHIYTVEESLLDGYKVTYSPANVDYTALKSIEYSFNVTNTRLWGRLKLLKTNELLEGLMGAKFKVYKANSDWSMGDEVTGYEIVTDSEGSYILDKLQFGDYILIEEEAPAGYARLKEPVQIQFTEVDQIVTIVNYPSYQLPPTGGRGSSRFYVGGGILIASAIAIWRRIKHKNTKKEMGR